MEDMKVREGVISTNDSFESDFSNYIAPKFQKDVISSQRFFNLARHVLAEISDLELFRKEVTTNTTEFNWRFENSKSYIKCASPLQGYHIEYGKVENGAFKRDSKIYPLQHLLADEDYAHEKKALVSFIEQFKADCEFDLASNARNYERIEDLQVETDAYVEVDQLEETATPTFSKSTDEMEL